MAGCRRIHGRPAHPGIPLEQARRGYSTGTAVLQAILPAHHGPTATVPVTLDDEGTQHQNGVDAKDAVLRQLDAALRVIDSSGAERILTLGGECSVSVGPFASLAAKYGEDLAIVWVDSIPMSAHQTATIRVTTRWRYQCCRARRQRHRKATPGDRPRRSHCACRAAFLDRR